MKISTGMALVIAVMGHWGCAKHEASPATSNAPTPDARSSNLNVIFRDAQGHELTKEDLKNATGRVRWEVVGAENVPEEADRLHQTGRSAGSRGEHAKALADFEKAARLAPQWPYPKYDAAFTYLLMGDSAKAEEFYVATVKLAPRGFFTALTAVDALRREREGEFPRGTYLAYVMLEWEFDPSKKLKTLRQMVERVPSFAPAWKDLAGLLEDDKSTLEAIEKGLAARPDAETKGILLMNRAALWNRQGKRNEAIRSLGELILAPESSLGNVELAKVTLANFTR